MQSARVALLAAAAMAVVCTAADETSSPSWTWTSDASWRHSDWRDEPADRPTKLDRLLFLKDDRRDIALLWIPVIDVLEMTRSGEWIDDLVFTRSEGGRVAFAGMFGEGEDEAPNLSGFIGAGTTNKFLIQIEVNGAASRYVTNAAGDVLASRECRCPTAGEICLHFNCDLGTTCVEVDNGPDRVCSWFDTTPWVHAHVHSLQ